MGLLLAGLIVPTIQFQGVQAMVNSSSLASSSLAPDTLAQVALSQTAEPERDVQFRDIQFNGDQSGFGYDRQGRFAYGQGDFSGAIAVWQQALEQYAQQQDSLAQARVLSNLSLAYQKLGRWPQAQQSINASVALLSTSDTVGTSADETARQRGLAQALNTQANLLFARGQTYAALITWEEAIAAYNAIADQPRAIQAQLNRIQAMQELGYHRRALEAIEPIHQQVQTSPALAGLRLTVLRQLGDGLRLVGKLERSQHILHEALALAQHHPTHPSPPPQQLSPEPEIAAILLSLGQTERIQGNTSTALDHYQQALNYSLDPALRLHIELARLQLQIDLQQWPAAKTTWLHAQTIVEQLPPNRNTIYAYINLSHQLMALLDQAMAVPRVRPPVNEGTEFPPRPHRTLEERTDEERNFQGGQAESLDWSTGEQLLNLAMNLAQSLGDSRAEAYAVGYLGRLYEQNHHWSSAAASTEQALRLGQALQSEDMMYQWQWQLGRILRSQGDQGGAIAAYSQAVNHLNTLRTDLLATESEGQFRFQEGVEPLYRELVDLLLTPGTNGQIPQSHLAQARDVMEAFQIAELDDFFQEACLDDEAVSIDGVDAEAAVIYPIILSDRLDVIISLPQQPLQHFSTPMRQAELNQFINDFRHNLVIRSRFDFRPQARQLYDWLLRPAAEWLHQHQIKTLVFVLDGPLRLIPMAVLHDGDRYLIEQYQVAIAPGLTLVRSTPLQDQSPQVLMAGLSQSRHGFSPLAYVEVELAQISDTVSGSVLLDERFTSQAFQQKIADRPFSLVHIASHGQFSSRSDNTFIIAWDGHLNIDEFRQILQSGQRSNQTPIDLLVLSACETATGDPRAPLGLAGMAVKAGAHSTLATQWSVNDGVTAQFMTQFYRNLAAGMTKAEALRQSQLWLLQFERFTHPIYWAPYVLIGDWN